MSVFYDTFINLLASAIIFALGFLANQVRMMIKKKGATQAWRMFESGSKMAIVLTMRRGPHATSTPRTSMTETISLVEIIPILRQLNIQFEVLGGYNDKILLSYDNYLSIGGPAANETTSAFFEKYKSKLPIKILSNPVGFEVGANRYYPEYSEDQKTILADYALIIAMQGDTPQFGMHEKHRVEMVIMGCRGYGTRGGILSMQNKKLIKYITKYSKKKSFIAVMRVEIQNNEISGTSLAHFYPII